jgi:hypothetical protein
MKNNPNTIVIINASIAFLNEPIAIAWCAHVIENPEIINTAVLNNGNSQDDIPTIPTGG